MLTDDNEKNIKNPNINVMGVPGHEDQGAEKCLKKL